MLTILLAILTFGGSRSASTRPAVQPDGEPRDSSCPAVVVPRRAVVVSAPRDGVVASIPVVLGQSLRAGETIAEFESRAIELELQAAQVAQAEAEGYRDKALIQLARADEVCKRYAERIEVFSEKERKDAEYDRRIATEELRIAEARIKRQALEIDRLQDLLNRSRVPAPFDGTVAVRSVDAGANVARGAPLVRLISSDDLMVRFAVPPRRMAGIREGALLKFQPLAAVAPVTILVRRIAPEIDPDLQAVVIEAEITAPASARVAQPGSAPATEWRAGMEGRVELD